MTNAKVVIDVDDSQLNAKLRQAETNIQNSFQKMANSGSVMDNQLASIKNQLAGLASVAVVGSFIKDIAQVRGEFQKYEAVLANTFQDEAKAAESMEMIASYAAKTNFQVSELTDSYVRLAGQGFKPTREEMTKLGDLAASKAKGFTQLSEAIIDAETFEFERLKEFGIRAAKDGEQITFTFKGIQTTVNASAESIRNYILSLGELDGVRGSTEAISKTIVGLASNFEDAWDKMLNTIGQSNEGAFADSIKMATQLVSNYDAVVDSLKVLIATYGVYKAAVIVSKILAEAEAAGTLANALKQTAIARRLLNVANAASPFGLALAGITALVGGFLVYQKHLKNTVTFTDELNRSISDEVISLNSLFGKLKETQTGTQERADTIKLTNERYGDYLGNLLTEKSTLEEIEKAQRNATNALIANISVQKSKDKLSEVLGDVSDKFDKEFSGFISKFGEVYGTDRIPEFVTAINSAIDTKIKEGGGKVERGMLEYSNIAKGVYDEFVKEISQKTGYLQFGFDDFQESFLDFAEFKAEKSGFIAILEGMISSYQGVLNKFNKSGESSGGGGGDKVTNVTDKIKELRKQLGTGDAKFEAEIILKIAKEQEYLDQFYKEVRDIVNESMNFNVPGKNIKPVGTKNIIDKKDIQEQLNPMKQLTAEEIKRLKIHQAQVDRLRDQQKQYEEISGGLKDASDVIGALSFAASGLDSELSQSLGKMADLAYNASNLFANMSTGNIIGAVTSGIVTLGNIFSLFKGDSQDDGTTKALENVNNLLQRQSVILANLSGNNYFELAAKQLEDYGKAIDANNKKLQQSHILTAEEYEAAQAYYNQQKQDFPNGPIAQIGWEKYRAQLNGEAANWTPQDFIDAYTKGSVYLNEQQIDWVNAIVESQKQRAELLQETFREALGFDANTVSDSIFDAIDEGLKLGENSLGEFSQSFGELMKTALMQSVVDGMNIKLTEGFLKDYKEYMEDGSLSPEERKALEDVYRGVVEQAKIDSENIKAITDGYGNGNKDGYSAITGSAISATEESVSLLYGQTMAMRVDLKSIADSSKLIQNQLEMMDQSLGVLQNIERNTRHNARLETIESNIAETNKILRERL